MQSVDLREPKVINFLGSPRTAQSILYEVFQTSALLTPHPLTGYSFTFQLKAYNSGKVLHYQNPAHFNGKFTVKLAENNEFITFECLHKYQLIARKGNAEQVIASGTYRFKYGEKEDATALQAIMVKLFTETIYIKITPNYFQ